MTPTSRRTRWLRNGAAVVVGFLACRDSVDPTAPGSIALNVEQVQGALVHLDAATAHVTGAKDTTVNLTQSGSDLVGTIGGLPAGTYALELVGFASGAVVYHAKATGIAVTAGNTATATVPSSAPFVASQLTAAASSGSQIALTWADSANGEDGFKVERCSGTCAGAEAASGKFSVVATTGANTTSYNDAGLANNATFTYRVRAYSGTNFSAYTNFATATTGNPTIALSPSTVHFAATPGGPNPQNQVVTVTNSGTGSLTGLTLGTISYVVGTPGWLSATISGTTAPATITLVATTGTLTAGNYSATIAVSAAGASNTPQTLTVNFAVSNNPAIALDQTTLGFAATASVNPQSRFIAVTNGGGGSLTGLSVGPPTYDASASGWLTTSLNSTAAPAILTVSAATGSLAAGTYTAVLPVSSTVAGNTQNIAVTFTVSSNPLISLSTGAVAFATLAGGSSPSPRSITVSNGGGGSLAGLTLGTITYGSGGNGWLGASLSTTTAPSTLTLTPALGSLPAGTYTATVPVTATGVGNSPQNVNVSFIVSASPIISASPAVASFFAAPGGASPPSQAISIGNVGGGALTGLSVGPIAYGAGASGWLNATLNTATAPATLTVTATTGTLPAGTYSAMVQVLSGVAANNSKNIPVTFTVSTNPLIGLSSTTAGFSGNVGGGSPANQTVNVTNVGGGSLTGLAVGTIQYQSTGGWLAASLNTAAAPAVLTLTATTGALTAGTYVAAVPITSGVAANSPQAVTVTFTVTAAPLIVLSPSSVSFAAAPGGANPANQVVTITNGAGATLNGLSVGTVAYGAGQPTGWLSTSISASTAPATVTISAATGALTAGTYTATVPITSGVATNSPQNISVTFVVSTNPLIAISSNRASFAAATGGANPLSQATLVLNGGGGSLTNLTVGAPTYGAGPSGWLTASLNQTTAPAILTLNATTGSLSAGTYTATLPISSVAAANAPQNVTVTFAVSAGPLIGLSVPTLSFVTPVSGLAASQGVNIVNAGGGSLTGLSLGFLAYGAGASGWLGANFSSTTAPSTLSIVPNTSGLAAGTYTASVPVTSSVGANSPQNIGVTWTISNSPMVALSAASANFTVQAGAASPAAQTIAVSNGGGGTLSSLAVSTVGYSAGGSGWLNASLNTTTAPATLTLTPNTGGLAAGTYVASVLVTSSVAVNPPALVSAILTVTPPPTISLNPTTLTFNATANGASPAGQTVAITNSGGGSLTTLSVDTIIYGAGATGWLATSFVAGVTTAPTTLNVSATTGSLLAGTYTATIRVKSPVAVNTPQDIAVTFNVAAPTGVDLVVTAFSIFPTPSPYAAGDPDSVAATVLNQGTVAAGSFRFAFYFSTDNVVNTSDALSNYSCTVPSLAPGATFTCFGYINVPPTLTPGTYFAAAIADDQLVVAEANETNNVSAPVSTTIATPLMTNGAFASGATGWTLSGNAIVLTGTTDATNYFLASGDALLGVDINGAGVDNGAGNMFQQVSIPIGSVAPTLTFWYNIATQETGSTPFDFLTVTVQNTSGAVLATVKTLSNVDAVTSLGYPNYRQVKFDLTPYIGTTVRINFAATTDAALHTIFRVDNVNVTKQ